MTIEQRLVILDFSQQCHEYTRQFKQDKWQIL